MPKIAVKKHLCEKCGENDEENFYKGRKSMCKKCECDNMKNNYIKSDKTNLKKHLCEKCGENDEENFYKGRKSMCKKCECKYKMSDLFEYIKIINNNIITLYDKYEN
jgi:hypothetical protein